MGVPERYHSKVEPGKEVVLFSKSVTSEEYLVFKGIGTRYEPGLKYLIYMDFKPYEIDWQLGDITNPYKFDKPFIIEYNLRIVARNESDEDKIAEIVIDYDIVKRKEVRIIGYEEI